MEHTHHVASRRSKWETENKEFEWETENREFITEHSRDDARISQASCLSPHV